MYESNPDYVNERGTQWWVDQDLTRFANEPDEEGIKLSAVGYYIKERDGEHAWVLVDANSEIIEFEEFKSAIYDRIKSKKATMKLNKKFFLPPTHP